jgi:hypothetical protein
MDVMSLLDDVKSLVNDAVNDIGDAGSDLKNDLESGITTIDTAVSNLKTKLQTDVANLENDFASVLSQAATGWNTFTNDLNTIRSVVSTWYSSADTQSAISDLKTMAQTRQLTSKTWADLDSMHASLVTAATNSSSAVGATIANTLANFSTFSVSFGADADIVSTFDGGMGFAIKTKNNVQDYRFTADLSVGIGADLEIDAFTNVGIWNKSPHEMKGSFFAVEAAAADAVGGAAVAVFDFPSIDLIGFIFAVEAGEGIDIDAKLGYTMTWD